MSKVNLDKKTIFKLSMIVVAFGVIGYKVVLPRFSSAGHNDYVPQPAVQHSSAATATPQTTPVTIPAPTVVSPAKQLLVSNDDTKKILELATKKLLMEMERDAFNAEAERNNAKSSITKNPSISQVTELVFADGKDNPPAMQPENDLPIKTADLDKFINDGQDDDTPADSNKGKSHPVVIDSIQLHGLIDIEGQTTALVSLNGGSLSPYGINSKIAETVTIEKITPDFVQLREGKFVKTLRTSRSAN